jgi:signal peptidase II
MDPGRRGATILFATAGCVFVVDRLTKIWAEHALADRPIDLIPGVLTLRLTTNSGGAFSLGQSAPWFFAGATVVVSALIVFTAFRRRSVWSSVALGLILGGAVGNLADRVLRGPGLSGHVVDFVDFHVWPVFNAADGAVVIGAILLAASTFLEGREENEDAAARDGP